MMWMVLIALAVANPNYIAGMAAMGNKNYDEAIIQFHDCIRDEEQNSKCHWELGWAYWMKNDWPKVVDSWRKVKKLNPKRKGLAKYLAQAEDNMGLDKLLKQEKFSAPETFSKAKGGELRIRAVGDMMIGTDFPSGYLPENNGKDTFKGVKDLLQDADITFGNLEGPVCKGGKTSKCRPGAPAGRCYAFRSPASYVKIYRDAGFNVVSTANNHANDFGRKCRLQTEQLLETAGIAHSGRPGVIAHLVVRGVKIALIGFATSSHSHNLNDHKRAATLVRALDKKNDIVLVSFHGGAEGAKAIHVPNGEEIFLGEKRGNLRKFARVVIDAGADAVIGHGPHVLRGMEIYKDRLIAYSLGNFATYGRFSLSGNKRIGAVLEMQLDTQGNFITGNIFATKQMGRGVPVKDPDGKAIDLIRKLSSDDFGASAVRIAKDGGIQKP